MGAIKLKVSNLSFGYSNSNDVFKNVNLSFKNNFYYLSGDSGVGKTTLIELLSGWLLPKKGKITIFDYINHEKVVITPNTKKTDVELQNFRKNLGIIFQDFHLDNDLSAYENVFTFLKMRQGKVTSAQYKKANSYLLSLGFSKPSELKGKKIEELSGGEQQRIAIVRALMFKPKVIFADEITSSLGKDDTFKIVSLLERYAVQNNALVLFATHDRNITIRKPHVAYFISKNHKQIRKYVYDKENKRMVLSK